MSGPNTDADGADYEEVRAELATFGLSEKEIQTYLSVLDHGEAEVSEISERADVSKRYAYNVAETLAERGLVRVNDHTTPTTVRARPPAEALDALASRLGALAPALERRFDRSEPQSAHFEEIKARRTALKRLRGILADVENEAFVSLPANVYGRLRSELEAAVERGVLVLLLLGDADGSAETGATGANGRDPAGRFDGAATVVRRWTENVPFMVVGDNRSAMVGDPDLLTGAHGAETAVALAQPDLAGSVLSTFISGFWPVADEVFVGDPRPLPATYRTLRGAVVQATLHRRNGTALRATVDPESGPTISGPVTDVRQGLVEPRTNDFPVENCLVIDAEDRGVISVGGPGAFVEDYAAESVRLAEDG